MKFLLLLTNEKIFITMIYLNQFVLVVVVELQSCILRSPTFLLEGEGGGRGRRLGQTGTSFKRGIKVFVSVFY